jgi:hypothetical protein
MNHTAILGLEVYLFYAALRRLRPDAPRPVATVWPGFLEMPVIGPFYKASGCIPMSVDRCAAALRSGKSVLILPEGPDATDVRDEVGPFHAGVLRVVQALQEGRGVPVVPLGWAGVDEANPWWVTTHPALVRRLMKPFMPRFEFALIPRPPILRPSKVVFVVSEPIRFGRGALDSETALRAELGLLRNVVVELVAEARHIREERIEDSLAEKVVHRVFGARRIPWKRRSTAEP